jgi:uncharacterized protein
MRNFATVNFVDVRLEGIFMEERFDTVLAETIPSQHEKLRECNILE